MQRCPVRCILTGTDSEGRSCVVEETEMGLGDGPVDVRALFRTRTDRPAGPGGRGEQRDLGVPAGQLQWVVTRWVPGAEAGTHHTDTIDLDLVVAGSIELVLDDGPHLLEAGDAAVVTGVDHAWRSGPEGCTLSVVLLGTPPAAAGGECGG